MIKPLHNTFDVMDFVSRRDRGAVNHDDPHAQGVRRIKLGAGRVAACVLADQRVDVMGPHQSSVTCTVEGTSRNLYRGIWRQDGVGLRRVDEAQQIVMRGVDKPLEVLAAYSEENAAGQSTDRSGGAWHIRHTDPWQKARLPGRAAESDQGGLAHCAGLDGVAAHTCRERMRGVHHMGDRRIAQIGHKACNPSKTARPRPDRLRLWRSDPPRVGIDGIDWRSSEALRQGVGFGRAAQKKDAG